MKHWIISSFLIFLAVGAAAQRVVIAEYPMSALNEKYFISLDTSDYVPFYKIGVHPAGQLKPIELSIAQSRINEFTTEIQAALKEYVKLSGQTKKGSFANDRMIELDLGLNGQELFARFNYKLDGKDYVSKPLFTKYYFNNKDGVNSLIITCLEETNKQTGQQEGAIIKLSSEEETGFFISCFNLKLVKNYLDAAYPQAGKTMRTNK